MLVCLCLVVWMQAKEMSSGSYSSEKWVGIIWVAFLQLQQKCHSLVACRPADGLEQMISKNFSKSKIL